MHHMTAAPKAGPPSHSTSAGTSSQPAASSASNPPPSSIQQRRIASNFLISKAEREAARNWDIFYKKNETRFFKDRHWTDREFEQDLKLDSSPQTGKDTGKDQSGAEEQGEEEEDHAPGRLAEQLIQASLTSVTDVKGKGREVAPVLLEVGCGVGNMIYPLLEQYPQLTCHACDFSKRAVEFVKTHRLYDPARVNAFVYDLCSTSDPSLASIVNGASSSISGNGSHQGKGIGPPTIISMIFVLSAIPPALHERALRSLVACFRASDQASPFTSSPPAATAEASSAEATYDDDSAYLPHATLLFRDYCQDDMAQTRFDVKNHSLPSYHEPTLLSLTEPYYRRGSDNTLAYFFDPVGLAALANRCGLEGEVVVRERVVENRKAAKVMRRRFVQARWRVRKEAFDDHLAVQEASVGGI